MPRWRWRGTVFRGGSRRDWPHLKAVATAWNERGAMRRDLTVGFDLPRRRLLPAPLAPLSETLASSLTDSGSGAGSYPPMSGTVRGIFGTVPLMGGTPTARDGSSLDIRAMRGAVFVLPFLSAYRGAV